MVRLHNNSNDCMTLVMAGGEEKTCVHDRGEGQGTPVDGKDFGESVDVEGRADARDWMEFCCTDDREESERSRARELAEAS